MLLVNCNNPKLRRRKILYRKDREKRLVPNPFDMEKVTHSTQHDKKRFHYKYLFSLNVPHTELFERRKEVLLFYILSLVLACKLLLDTDHVKV